RVVHVERHSEAMVAEAAGGVAAVCATYVAIIEQLSSAREVLLDAVEVRQWAARFPSESASAPLPNRMALGLARRTVSKTLGVEQRVEYRDLVAALEADAAAIQAAGTDTTK